MDELRTIFVGVASGRARGGMLWEDGIFRKCENKTI